MTVYGAVKSHCYQFKAVAALLLGTKQKLEPPKTHQVRTGCQKYKSVWKLESHGLEEGEGRRGGGEANLFLCKSVWSASDKNGTHTWQKISHIADHRISSMYSLPQSFTCDSSARLRRKNWNTHEEELWMKTHLPDQPISVPPIKWVGLEYDLNFLCIKYGYEMMLYVCVKQIASCIVKIPRLAGPKSQLHQMFCVLPFASNHHAALPSQTPPGCPADVEGF